MHRFELKVMYFMRNEINELFIMNAMRSFALSTISIFIPIFLIEKGYSMMQVAAYLLLWVTTSVFASYSALKFSSKRGVKHTLALSIPLSILFFMSLYKIEALQSALGFSGALILISVLKAVNTSFYFMGFHIDFARFSKSGSSGQLGVISATATILSIIGPLLGSVIITSFSYNALFLFVISVLMASIVPLFFTKDFHEPFEFDFRNLRKNFSKDNAWAFIGEGIRAMAGMYFWPILFFLVIKSLGTIGGVYSVSKLLLAGITLYIAKKATEGNRKKILKLGAYLHSFSMLSRVFLKTAFMITLVQGFGGLSWAMISLPYQSIFYSNSKKRGVGYMTYYRELFLSTGRIIAVLMLMLLLKLFSTETALIAAVIAGAIAVFAMMVIDDI